MIYICQENEVKDYMGLFMEEVPELNTHEKMITIIKLDAKFYHIKYVNHVVRQKAMNHFRTNWSMWQDANEKEQRVMMSYETPLFPKQIYQQLREMAGAWNVKNKEFFALADKSKQNIALWAS